MRIIQKGVLSLASFAAFAAAASVWTFDDASLTVQAKGAGIGSGAKQKLSPSSKLSSPVAFAAADTLKLTLTTKEGNTAKRPHQAFLTLHEHETGLEESFAFAVKANGKSKLELTQKDIPQQLLLAKSPLEAKIVLGSFGSSTPTNQHIFDLAIAADSASSVGASSSSPERYAAKPEIHHIFRADARSPPKIISLVFTLAVLATVPVLLGTWTLLGGNLAHLSKAFGANPGAHALFIGGILAMEGVFFMYYVSWNLFQTLPIAGIVGVVTYISGSRALTEVQERRIAGER